jgi:tetratricopeptide (TPR) repeat protein
LTIDRERSELDLATKPKRIKKRQLKEDQFVTTTFQLAGYLQEHRNQAILAVAGAIVLILAASLLIRFQASSKESTRSLLSQGVGMFQAGNYADAAYRFSTFLRNHPRHDDADYAAVLCGDANFYLGRYEDAGRYYRTALEKADEGSEYWFSARAGLAALEQAAGRPLEAAALYEELAARREDPARKAHLQYQALRCYREGGDFERAGALLDQLEVEKLDPIDLASYDVQKAAIEAGREMETSP